MKRGKGNESVNRKGEEERWGGEEKKETGKQ